MLIRFTKDAGGHTIGKLMDAGDSQAEKLIDLGIAVPVEHGKDGRVVIKRSARKVPRRDRSVINIATDEQVDEVS